MSTELVKRRAARAITLAFVADALAMPVHWFYDPKDITNAFGDAGVTKFEAPTAKHPYTFMKAPEPDEKSGKRIVGEVIHKKTAANWGPENQHVHVGLPPGHNTLNAEIANHAVLRQLCDRKGVHDVDAYVKKYVDVMTADPQVVEDSYAEGFHRAFFAKLTAGEPLEKCADDSEGAESIGGLTTAVPAILVELARDGDAARVKKLARDHVARTHNRPRLLEITDILVDLYATLLRRDSDAAVAPAINEAFKKAGADGDLSELITKADGDVIGVKGQPFGSFCDVKASWPTTTYVTLKYAGNVSAGLLANVNVGGENCHRGFVIGSLLALTSDASADEAMARFAGGLHDKSIKENIDAVFASF